MLRSSTAARGYDLPCSLSPSAVIFLPPLVPMTSLPPRYDDPDPAKGGNFLLTTTPRQHQPVDTVIICENQTRPNELPVECFSNEGLPSPDEKDNSLRSDPWKGEGLFFNVGMDTRKECKAWMPVKRHPVRGPLPWSQTWLNLATPRGTEPRADHA